MPEFQEPAWIAEEAEKEHKWNLENTPGYQAYLDAIEANPHLDFELHNGQVVMTTCPNDGDPSP